MRTGSGSCAATTCVSRVPVPERTEPFAFLEDIRLPPRITLVEPTAFALACVQAAWGPYGPRN